MEKIIFSAIYTWFDPHDSRDPLALCRNNPNRLLFKSIGCDRIKLCVTITSRARCSRHFNVANSMHKMPGTQWSMRVDRQQFILLKRRRKKEKIATAKKRKTSHARTSHTDLHNDNFSESSFHFVLSRLFRFTVPSINFETLLCSSGFRRRS